MEMSGGGGIGNTGNSRWNPTKEQISILENLYRQGIRTPSAEQIQQITTRLKVYGSIEGKNVFYWFQNHKARQRQKQKQLNNIAYINRYLHSTHHHQPAAVYPPLIPPAGRPANGDHLGFYPKCPKVILPSGVKRRGRPDKIDNTRFCGTGVAAYHNQVHHQGYNYTMMMPDTENYVVKNGSSDSNHDHQTLALFPLHPTGASEGISTTAGIDHEGSGTTEQQYFFDFFSCQGCSETD